MSVVFKKRILCFVYFVGLCCAVDAQTPVRARDRGVGPFTIQTKRGNVTVKLLRREKDLVWFDQLIASNKVIETGIDLKDIIKFDIPRLKVFDLAMTATTSNQITQMTLALKKVSEPLKPYRDLPGMIVDEALYLQAQLMERADRWREALLLYEDILQQPYKPKEVELSRFRAGLCLVELQQHEKALEYLNAEKIPDDDLELLSDIYFARAGAKAGARRHSEAILDYLQLVVFYPFVKTNEARCLSAVLPSYAAIEDWDAAWKTMDTLRKQYPDTKATKQAEAFVKKFEEKLAEEKQYQTPDNEDTGESP